MSFGRGRLPRSSSAGAVSSSSMISLQIDALVADVDAGPGDQLLDLPLALAAEAAEELLVGVGRSSHVSGE